MEKELLSGRDNVIQALKDLLCQSSIKWNQHHTDIWEENDTDASAWAKYVKGENYLEFHAVPKSLLSNKRALLCFMTSLSRWHEIFSSPDFSSFTDGLPWALYCAIAVINAFLAALYNGRRISIEMPNLWSLFQKLEIPSSDCSKWWLDEGRTPPASSFRMKNWDGWINPTSSLEEN